MNNLAHTCWKMFGCVKWTHMMLLHVRICLTLLKITAASGSIERKFKGLVSTFASTSLRLYWELFSFVTLWPQYFIVMVCFELWLLWSVVYILPVVWICRIRALIYVSKQHHFKRRCLGEGEMLPMLDNCKQHDFRASASWAFLEGYGEHPSDD